MSQISEIRNKVETYMATAKRILDRAEAERRELTPNEKTDWTGLLDNQTLRSPDC